MRQLDFYFHDHCLSRQSILLLAGEIEQGCPDWHIVVHPLLEHEVKALGFLVLPTIVMNGRVVTTGIPEKDWLLERMKECEPTDRQYTSSFTRNASVTDADGKLSPSIMATTTFQTETSANGIPGSTKCCHMSECHCFYPAGSNGERSQGTIMKLSAFSSRFLGTGVVKLGLFLALLAGTYMAASWLNLGEFLNPEQLAAHLHAAGPFGPILFMLLMAMAVVISPIPSLPLDLAAGATFGVTLGTLYAVIGAEIGAVLSFLIGRSLGREALTKLLRIEITFCERCSDRHLAIFVFLSRLLPIFSFDLVSYGAGLTNMSLRAFALATFLGMMLPTYLLTSLGGHLAIGEWPLILMGMGLVGFLFLAPKLMVRYSSSRWLSLLRGDMPVPLPQYDREKTGQASCPSCGGTLP